MRPRADLALALALGGAACGSSAEPPPLPLVDDPIPYVDPTIGSGGFGYGFGSAFPGAAAPHGLVKVGPDTKGRLGTASFQHYSGYWAEDDTIQGFSHLHLHGTGATDYGVLSLMPISTFDPSKTTAEANESKFDKAGEHASPGSYTVTLANGATVELAATPHAAYHRYSFPDASPRAVLIDLAKHLDGGVITDAALELDPVARKVTGRLHHNGGMSGGFGGYDVYFELRSATPWVSSQTWSDAAPPAPGTSAAGTGVGAVLVFDASNGIDPIDLQVGVSLVAAGDAGGNLDLEMAGRDLLDVRVATEAQWRELLSTILVEGGTMAERRMFYSALYRAFLMPTIMSDTNGSYVGMDRNVVQADGFRYMSDMSLWDTYRTVHPLYALIAPESARDAARSLVAMAQASGSFPRWPIATGESGVMVGASAEVVLADAYVKGIQDFDAAWAYDALRAAAMDPTPPPGGRGGRGEVEEYIARGGWLPTTISRSVGKTIEFSHDDFALAELAAALGHDADATALRERRLGYHQLYDPSVGFLRGRRVDDTFPTGSFDPLDLGDEYVEANAWHTLWAAPHDADGLIDLLGGPQPFVDKLTTFFEEAAADWEAGGADDTARQAAPRPYYWHGNEPDIHAAYLFARAGRPDLTDRWVRWIMGNLYSDRPSGLAGNDDGGTLSAWYVFSALGFYPIAGSTTYVIGTPLFTKALVRRPDGILTIDAPGASDARLYVTSVALDGAPLAGPLIDHAQLGGGKTITFEMSDSAP